jgi:NADH-quinone oxidoreductase subunit L
MWAPLAILAVFSLGFVGYAMEAGHWLKDWLAPWGATEVKTAKNVSHDLLTILSIVVGTTGILGALVAYRKLPNSEGFDLSKWNPLRRAAAASFYTDWYSNKGSGMLASGVGAVVKLFDVGIIDNIVKAVGSIFGVLLSAIGKRFQTGYVRNYALMMLVGGSAIIVYALVQVMGGKF